ncbi:hypothetical protein SDC9_158375 [bioreactor metagenome]|uniref:Uncharacterized protein n=1 Tax=bioreactor metagenome TaxID=1076179 RepID=A0A645FEZ8_9ZZZZ
MPCCAQEFARWRVEVGRFVLAKQDGLHFLNDACVELAPISKEHRNFPTLGRSNPHRFRHGVNFLHEPAFAREDDDLSGRRESVEWQFANLEFLVAHSEHLRALESRVKIVGGCNALARWCKNDFSCGNLLNQSLGGQTAQQGGEVGFGDRTKWAVDCERLIEICCRHSARLLQMAKDLMHECAQMHSLLVGRFEPFLLHEAGQRDAA